MYVDEKNTVLFNREGAYIPRVAAVHDLCGYGKCSLGVAIPVLSAAGCDVCAVPTGLFSSHTAFPGWYMHDTSAILADYLAAWEHIGVEIDAIYSGFLSDPVQVDIIEKLWATYPHALRVVDPVMADHGKVYPTYTPELCAAMARLACNATLLTPNLTEASILLGTSWEGEDVTDETAHGMVEGLLNLGAENVILKGVHREGEQVMRNFTGHRNAQGTVVFGEIANDYLPYQLHGTGDLYCSCVLAALMVGKPLEEAAAFAGAFVHDAIEVSTLQPNFRDRGVSFEPLLGRVAALLER